MIHFSQAQRDALEPLSTAFRLAMADVLRIALTGSAEDLEAVTQGMQRAKDALHTKAAAVLGVPVEEMNRLTENPETTIPMNFLN